MDNDFVVIAITVSFGLNVLLILRSIITDMTNSKNVNLAQINQLISILEPRVAQTPTQLDDIGLSIGKQIRDMLSQQGNPASDEGGDIVGEYNENRGV